MMRAVFIAYLAISAALGPAVCCCQLRQLVSTDAVATGCCGNAAAELRIEPSSHSCCAHEPRELTSVSNPKGFANTDLLRDSQENSPAPCKSHCPCGRHEPGLLANSVSLVSFSASMSWPAPKFTVDFSALSWGREFLATGTPLDFSRPAALAGREMLRAYHILRC